MGIVSGDVASCECEPAAPVSHTTVRTIESTALRGSDQGSGAKVQVLDLTAETKVCLSANDVSTFTVKYHSGDGEMTSALAFKVQFDARFFALQTATLSPNVHCSLSSIASASTILTADQRTSVPYVCHATNGADIIPGEDDSIMELTLVALGGHQGVTTVSIVPDPYIHPAG